MKLWPAVVLLALAGCDNTPKRDFATEDSQANPAGRYQLASDPKGGVFRLDTRYGNVSHCEASGSGTACDPETASPR